MKRILGKILAGLFFIGLATFIIVIHSIACQYLLSTIALTITTYVVICIIVSIVALICWLL
jgi:hypothetical protein